MAQSSILFREIRAKALWEAAIKYEEYMLLPAKGELKELIKNYPHFSSELCG